jgi:hypothetical protein
MNHVKVGDKEYTIIKVVTSKRHYCDKTDDYDVEFDIEQDNSDIIDVKDCNSGEEYDKPKSNSYALF